jgi:hypothetical protein
MASHAKRFIRPEYVENVIQAVGFAEQLHCPLNAHFTVTWFNPDDAIARKCQTAVLERYQKWAKYRGFRAAYTWSLERSPKLGVHSHILLHIPPALRHELRRRMFKRWVTEVCGFWKDKMVRGRKVPRKLEPVRGEQRMTTIADLERRTLYQVKDIEPDSELASLLPFHRLRKRNDRGGSIVGKRVGTSRNIGAFYRTAHRPGANDNGPQP